MDKSNKNNWREWGIRNRKYALYSLISICCSCTSIEPRDAYVAWKTDCSAGISKIHFIDTYAPVVDCIKASPPADAGLMVLMTLIGNPVLACVVMWPGEAFVFENLNYGHISDEVLQHELEHQWGMAHPKLFPLIHTCKS